MTHFHPFCSLVTIIYLHRLEQSCFCYIVTPPGKTPNPWSSVVSAQALAGSRRQGPGRLPRRMGTIGPPVQPIVAPSRNHGKKEREFTNNLISHPYERPPKSMVPFWNVEIPSQKNHGFVAVFNMDGSLTI